MAHKGLGELEQLVLLAIARLDGDAYAVSVIDEIVQRTDRTMSHAAVYVVLGRLEDKGLVTSHLGDSTPARGGRPKRFYEVTPEAMTLLKTTRQGLLAMWDGLEALTG